MLAKSVISFNFPLFLHTATFAEAVERFNSNIPYNGLLHAVTQDVSTMGHWVSHFVSVSSFVTNSFFFPSLKLSIVYSLQGLFAENKEKLITGAITALLAMEGETPSHMMCILY